MAVKLYVGNLPYTTTDDDLKELFAPYGNVVSATVITDRDSGRSKGFGFVEMETDEEAKAAIEALNGKDFGGRNLVVNEARPREERSDRPRDDRPRRDGGNSFRQRSW
ncbi:MAG TPA: RNA-binding protein [Magnetospirillaceae bacterium]|nr:RNA-binding protein [Magnetospirillaceae bacterium]